MNVITFLIAIVCLVLWAIWLAVHIPWATIVGRIKAFSEKKNGGQPKGDDPAPDINKDEMRQVLSQMLEQLSCDPKWEDSDDSFTARFDYQGGHFVAVVTDNNPNVEISFPFVFGTSTENLGLVRNLCNQFNMASQPVKFVYSISDDGKKADVHVKRSFLIENSRGKQLVTYGLRSMFEGQRFFVSHFKELEEKFGKTDDKDIDVQVADRRRELSLLREYEMASRMFPKDIAHTTAVDGGLDIGDLFWSLQGLFDVEFRTMTITGDNMETKVIEGKENIANCNVETFIVDEENGVFAHTNVSLFIVYKEMGKDHDQQMAILLTKDLEMPHSILYYRITMATIPMAINKEITLNDKNHMSNSFSFIVAHDFTPHKQLIDEFTYIWKEALAKAEDDDRDSMTEEQKLLVDCTNPDIAHCLYFGKKYYLHNRAYEALPLLLKAFCLQQYCFDYFEEHGRKRFAELCYLIGSCYMGLKQYEKAYYYLDLTPQLSDERYIKQMINCLVSMDNVRAETYVDNLLTGLSNDAPIGDLDEGKRDLYNFLRRQKVAIFIRKRKMNEAEKLLREMLTEPDNADFALSKLARMQSFNRKMQ